MLLLVTRRSNTASISNFPRSNRGTDWPPALSLRLNKQTHLSLSLISLDILALRIERPIRQENLPESWH